MERRAGGELSARAIDGRGKRAALASYYAPLHFLTTHHAIGMLPRPARGGAEISLDIWISRTAAFTQECTKVSNGRRRWSAGRSYDA